MIARLATPIEAELVGQMPSRPSVRGEFSLNIGKNSRFPFTPGRIKHKKSCLMYLVISQIFKSKLFVGKIPTTAGCKALRNIQTQ